MGRKEGIVEGEEEPYVAELGLLDWWAPEDWDRLCWEWDGMPAVDMCGFVNSSKRSASRGWCMWRWVAEESLLWENVRFEVDGEGVGGACCKDVPFCFKISVR